MKLIVLIADGRPDEIQQLDLNAFIARLPADGPVTITRGPQQEPIELRYTPDQPTAFASAAHELTDRLANDYGFVSRVMGRLPLRPRQVEFFRVLHAAPEDAYVTRDELCHALGITARGLAGTLGPLGARINATPREDMQTTVGIGVLFTWIAVDQPTFQWAYRLRPSVRRWLDQFFAEHDRNERPGQHAA
jgi:hypothetical protein